MNNLIKKNPNQSTWHRKSCINTKLNITLEKLRRIIINEEVINNCKYEFF